MNSVELAKSEVCDFSCIKLALQKVSVSRKYKFNQEISTIYPTALLFAQEVYF